MKKNERISCIILTQILYQDIHFSEKQIFEMVCRYLIMTSLSDNSNVFVETSTRRFWRWIYPRTGYPSGKYISSQISMSKWMSLGVRFKFNRSLFGFFDILIASFAFSAFHYLFKFMFMTNSMCSIRIFLGNFSRRITLFAHVIFPIQLIDESMHELFPFHFFASL